MSVKGVPPPSSGAPLSLWPGQPLHWRADDTRTRSASASRQPGARGPAVDAAGHPSHGLRHGAIQALARAAPTGLAKEAAMVGSPPVQASTGRAPDAIAGRARLGLGGCGYDAHRQRLRRQRATLSLGRQQRPQSLGSWCRPWLVVEQRGAHAISPRGSRGYTGEHAQRPQQRS